MIKILGKGFTRAAKGHNKMNHMDKKFLFTLHPLSDIEITKYFN